MRHRDFSHLDRLRSWRVRDAREDRLQRAIDTQGRQIERTGRRLGEFVDAWQELLPPSVTAYTRITSMRDGVVQVVVESSAVLYEVTGLLKQGLEAELRRRVRGTVRRIRLQIGPLKDPEIAGGDRR